MTVSLKEISLTIEKFLDSEWFLGDEGNESPQTRPSKYAQIGCGNRNAV